MSVEVAVKISKNTFKYTDKKDGTEKEMRCIVLEFPNGKSINLTSSRFNYRVFDYLTDLIENKNA